MRTWQAQLRATKTRGGAAPWWLPAGIDTTQCIGAYAAIGAASFAASLAALNDLSGEADLTEAVALDDWDTGVGWIGTALAQPARLVGPQIPGQLARTLMVRGYSTATTPVSIIASNSIATLSLYTRAAAPSRRYVNGGSLNVVGYVISDTTMGVAGSVAYLGGVEESTEIPAGTYSAGALALLSSNFVGIVSAAAVYSVTLTQGQMAQLHVSMMALGAG